jgi:hypothetical protein
MLAPSAAGNSTSATVTTVWDTLGGPLSNLTKTGANEITLYHPNLGVNEVDYGYNSPYYTCVYTVRQGSRCKPAFPKHVT